MLSDKEIIKAISEKLIRIIIEIDGQKRDVIDPNTGDDTYAEGSLQSHGYDLRIRAVRPALATEWVELHKYPGNSYKINPWETIEIRSLEQLFLPKEYAATLHSLASIREVGLSSISGTIHPGWGGLYEGPEPLIIHLTNLTKYSVSLEYGQHFCRIVFHKISNPGLRPPPMPHHRQMARNQQLVEKAKEVRRLRWRGIGYMIFVIGGVVASIFILQNLDFIKSNSGLSGAVNVLMTALLFFVIRYLNGKYKVFNNSK